MMLAKLIHQRNKITLVFEVFLDGPNAVRRIGDFCRGEDTEFIESALQGSLSSGALVPMDSIDVNLTTVHDGNERPFEHYRNG